MDFGIARVCAIPSITLHGSMMGTPGYMAPEQILGQPADIRADVYAVGAILYRLLAGEAPFAGGTTADLIQRQLSEEPQPLRSRRADVPESYQKVVLRAMAKAPDDRFRTTDEFRQALGRVSGTLKVINLSKRLARECPGDSALMSALEPLAENDGAAVPDTVRLHRHDKRKVTTAVAVLAAAIVALLVSVNTQDPAHSLIDGATSSTAPAAQGTDRPERVAEPSVLPPVPVAPAVEPPTKPPSPAPPSSEIPTAAALSASPAAPSRGKESSGVSNAARLLPKSATVAAAAPHESGASATPSNTTRAAEHAASNAAALGAASAAPSAAAAVDERPAEGALTHRPDPNFKAKFLPMADAKARELDVRLTLGDRALTVMASDDSGRQLQTVDYTSVIGVSYSVGRDPLVQSPDGPAPVLRRGGMLRKLGLSTARHWIVLSTQPDSFVVLQVNEEAVPAVLSLLEDHTGLRFQRLTDAVARAKE
jgi:hypothetical protein